MRTKIYILFILLSVALTGCKSKQKTISKRPTDTNKTIVSPRIVENKEEIKKVVKPEIEEKKVTVKSSYAEIVSDYINEYRDIAKEEMLQYGIPASITLAQGILESGAGRGELTKKANNHFGIKCHRGWTGDKVYHDDDESQECFRKYRDPKYSYRDHSLFLTQRSRYQDLFKLKKNDYKGWANGLRKAGYATDPLYPQKLIGIIERYGLDTYDKQVLGGEVTTVDDTSNKIKTYTVKKGDTLYYISRRFNITVDTLKEYNGLESNSISIGQVLYLHPIEN